MERFRIAVDGKSYHVEVEKLDADPTQATGPSLVRAAAPAAAPAVPAPSAAVSAAPAAAAGDMVSPLAGIVQALEVGVGDEVKEGDLVVTLEAMKMYTPINATSTGTIKAIHVKVGDAVEEGQPLFTIG